MGVLKSIMDDCAMEQIDHGGDEGLKGNTAASTAHCIAADVYRQVIGKLEYTLEVWDREAQEAAEAEEQ